MYGGICGQEKMRLIMHNHHLRNLREERVMINFFTTYVFFFAGEVTVSMPYLLKNLQLVVLVLGTHSIEGDTRIGTSMELNVKTSTGTTRKSTAQIFSIAHMFGYLFLRGNKGIMEELWNNISFINIILHFIAHEYFAIKHTVLDNWTVEAMYAPWSSGTKCGGYMEVMKAFCCINRTMHYSSALLQEDSQGTTRLTRVQPNQIKHYISLAVLL